MSKRTITYATALIFLLFAVGKSSAQQLPQYSQYVLNYYALNPAAAGSYGCTDIRTGYRTQWVGFEGAPKTAVLSMNQLLKRRKKVWRKNRHGIGFLIESDATGSGGPIRQTNFYVSYAYHVALMGNSYFAAGLFGGFVQYSLQTGNFNAADNGIIDPGLAGNTRSLVYPDFNPGILLYNPNQFIGLSIKKIVGNRISAVPTGTSRYARHLVLTMGKSFYNEYSLLKYSPSLQVMWTTFGAPSIMATMAASYNNNLEAGVFYRTISDCIGAYIQWKVNKCTFAYSFDYTLSKIRVSSANTHEIIIGYRICPKKELPSQTDCPAFK
jgi:type IX secretion system PorP/SprF family membrane protein